MSELVQPYLNKLKSIEGNLESIAQNIVKVNAKYIIALLREKQLGLGFDGFGKDLVHPTKSPSHPRVAKYEKSTEVYWAKQSPKPRTPKKFNTRYNFEWTGNFVDNLNIEKYEKDSYSIFSRAGKQRALEALYGTKLTKLTEENNKHVNDTIILPELQKYILENMFDV